MPGGQRPVFGALDVGIEIRSAKSLTMQPAERISTTPRMKIATIAGFG